jgi:hypothetical protein
LQSAGTEDVVLDLLLHALMVVIATHAVMIAAARLRERT